MMERLISGGQRSIRSQPSMNSMMSRNWDFGQKTIGFFGGFCLMLNNAIGAGVAAIPLIFVQGGWFIPLSAMIILGILGHISGAMMCEAMRFVPGNEHFAGRIEYAKCVKFFLGKYFYYITIFFLIMTLLTMNIAAIIISAQGVDQSLVKNLTETCGLEVYPSFGIVCSSLQGVNSPFSGIVISGGYLICLIVAVPLGLLNLDDNIGVQIVSTMLCLFCIALWIYELLPRVDATTYFHSHTFGYDYSQVLGSVMANFAFVITVPSWANEKRPDVSINKTIIYSVVFCIVCYSAVGIMAAATFAHKLGKGADFLALMGTATDSRLTQITFQFFPLLTALTGVPICSIIIRYNLVQSKIVPNVLLANLIAVGIPWIISIPLQTMGGGQELQNLLNWGSLLFGSVCNFVIPFILYIAYRSKRRWQIENGDDREELLLDGNNYNQMMPYDHWALPGNQKTTWRSEFSTACAMLMIILIVIAISMQGV